LTVLGSATTSTVLPSSLPTKDGSYSFPILYI
jgi:hypothetical protein